VVLAGEEHRLLGALPVERARLDRQQEGAGRADAGRLGRGRDAEQDDAENDAVRMPSGITDEVRSLMTSKRSASMRQ
jgi:hypothetical protein